MYLMISTYLVPLDEVDQAREEHLAFVAGLEERGLCVSAGRRNPAIGGVVLLAVDTEAEARAVMADDPYLLRGLAEYNAMGWNPTRGALAGWRSPA